MPSEIILTLLRHGRSQADDENLHEGRFDSPLTAVGERQSQQRLSDWKSQGVVFDRIIASPLQRAARVAQIMGEGFGAPIELEADWMEFDNGPLAGLTIAEAERRFPQPAFRNPYQAFWETGESEAEFHRRISQAVEKLVRRGPGTTLVVAHGGSINAALRLMLGIPIPINWHGAWFVLGDLGFVRLSYFPENHKWLVRELNPGTGIQDLNW